MNSVASLNAYKNVGLESGVVSADPHKLIVLLYQGAILAISSAKNQMLHKDVAAKGTSISKAIMIINGGLKASLDPNVGGELTQNLSSLYDYMTQRLLTANLNNDAAMLDEVAKLLSELKGAWESIRPATTAEMPPVASPATAKQAALVYGRM